MSAELAQSFLDHPLYGLAMTHFQQGHWKAGLVEVNRLVKLYPLEQELRSLRQDLKLRARIDHSEPKDRRIESRQKLRKRALRLVGGLIVISLFLVGTRSLSSWVAGQVELARQRVEHEIQIAMLASKERDVQVLIRVDRLEEAKALLDEMTALDPNYPALDQLQTELSAAVSRFEQYTEATELLEQQDWFGAKLILEAISSSDPNYRDVSLQMAHIEKQTLIGNVLSQAESSFQSGSWEKAILAFENVRTLHPQHQPEFVEQRLFDAYVNAARNVLIGQSDSLEALGIAAGYFRKALMLRPQDPDIKHERELAGLFLTAQRDFEAGRWSDVITGLEIVLAIDSEYAQGTARQTLYDSYAARGDLQMQLHLYDAALSDFERGVALAEQDPEAALRLFEAQLRVAEAHAAMGNFEAAVVHYRAAAESGGLVERGTEQGGALQATLQDAARYAASGNFSVAYERYRQVMNLADATQSTNIHIVQEGEYLTLIAGRYGSTVRAIVDINEIENSNLIFPGQELAIPVLP
jgi:tetratricopeptide (TPR) repeat protein